MVVRDRSTWAYAARPYAMAARSTEGYVRSLCRSTLIQDRKRLHRWVPKMLEAEAALAGVPEVAFWDTLNQSGKGSSYGIAGSGDVQGEARRRASVVAVVEAAGVTVERDAGRAAQCYDLAGLRNSAAFGV